MSDDGYNTTVVLSCGDTIRLNIQPDTLVPAAVGHYASCSKHSAIIGYDPQYGEPEYERDVRIVEVRSDRPTP